ncbi:hypothetical protein MGG_10282 [Pyricularia oryzae 70-15]|uniref:Uncharacterized protein n=4 Tax=Pyricularia oryzae TaxID=318829 RepID=G5EHK3_PYRO7|nr:uncharacterized protein MGG_10282 [Pyricularia oryzae 70-15]ELQ33131.1 hypothetical protein OOU_Y34scaffold01000g1 [Pyricularia oryzae Y34]KAI7909035.1 hypothetical protein M9X92_011869 [Pyricularia oryzae]EAQ71645.1 hypothetical protein MGCH7_ch7g1052 [Pyricularia oryzae 70-15]EHA45813.1 hypothetical protein MGG_10282 [Pyricularia oryzae 70-15]KAI7910005.1 hypothetical protein M0657_011577 [Pyricularia oryzae]
MHSASFLATAVIAGMASPVLAVALPADPAPAPAPVRPVFGCFVRMSIVTTDKDSTSINSGDLIPTTNPGQVDFKDGSDTITVKLDKNCQPVGNIKHRKEVQFNALQKLTKNGGPFTDPDQPFITF